MANRTKIILVVVVVALVVVYYRFVWTPASRKLADRRDVYHKVSTELRKTEVVAANLERVQRRYEVLTERWEKAKVMLPKEKEVPSLLEGITTAGMKSGIKFDLFEPQATLPRGIYSEFPINVGVTGDFHDMAKFLSAIGNLPRIVNIADIQLKGTTKKMLDVDFKALTYIITEGGGGENVE
nr:MAG: hypothetical protein AM324_09990 [Candidatus Thorarchaeota archaeon SMTZ1-83]